MALVKVANASDLAPGHGMLVQAEGRDVALFNVDGSFYVLDDVCSHAGGPLSEGSLEGYKLTCPWHGSIFDVRSGQVLGPPAKNPVASHKVVVQDSEVFIDLQP